MANHRNVIVALDEGTSNAKAVAIDAEGRVLCQSSRPLSVQTPRAGWVEQCGEVLIEQSLAALLPQHDIFNPDADRHARLQESWRNWQIAVERTLWQPRVVRGIASNNVEMM